MKLHAIYLTALPLVWLGCIDKQKNNNHGIAGEEEAPPAATTGTLAAKETAATLPQITGSSAQLTDSGITSVNNAVVTADAGTLVLKENISTRPNTQNSSASLRLVATDFDNHQEQVFSWDPAQEPLKAMNKILCVMANTGYHLMANAGSYVAKVTMKDCFQKDQMASVAPTGSNNQSTLTDVTVISAKPKNKTLTARAWFAMDKDNLEGMTMMSSLTEEKVNFYIELIIAEPISNSNPYGIFSLKWQGYVVETSLQLVQGSSTTTYVSTEKSTPYYFGYIDVSRSATDKSITLKYRETSLHYYDWSYWDNVQMVSIPSTFENSLVNQAIAHLKIAGSEAVFGTARTKTNYGWRLVSGVQDAFTGTDQSGSYSTAYDLDTLRAITKWIPSSAFNQQGSWAGGWDPTAKRCEKMAEPVPFVFELVPFKANGTKLNHKVSFPVTNGGTGWGWVDSWNLSVPSGTTDGGTVYIKNADDVEVAYLFYEKHGVLLNNNWQDITAAQSSDLTLACSSNCPKAGGITKAEFDGNTYTLSGGPHTYVFEASSRSLKKDGVPVSLASDIVDAYISTNMTAGGSTNYTYLLKKSSWTKHGVLRVKNIDNTPGDYFLLPTAITFTDRAYNHSQDGYEYSLGSAHNGTNLSQLGYGGMSGEALKYDGWSLCCIGWEEKSTLKNQFGNSMWGPKVTFKKGFSLTAANTTGTVTAGETIKFAPAFTELRSLIVSDCSTKLHEAVDGAATKYTLPEDLSSSEQAIKLSIGSKPNPTDLGTKIIDGKSSG